MIEFLRNYGLWFVLAGVFIAMHRFGTYCCGAGHRRKLPQNDGPSHEEHMTDKRP